MKRPATVMAMVMALTLSMVSAAAADSEPTPAAPTITISADGAPNLFAAPDEFNEWVADAAAAEGIGRFGTFNGTRWFTVDDLVVSSDGDFGSRTHFVTWISSPTGVRVKDGFGYRLSSSVLRRAGEAGGYDTCRTHTNAAVITFGVLDGEMLTGTDCNGVVLDAIGIVGFGIGEREQRRDVVGGMAPLQLEVTSWYGGGLAQFFDPTTAEVHHTVQLTMVLDESTRTSPAPGA